MTLKTNKAPKETETFKRFKRFAKVLTDMTNKVFIDDNLPTIELVCGNHARYKSFKAFQDDVKAYFLWSADNVVAPSKQGITLWLGWYSDLWYNYIKKAGYADILKKAEALIAYRYELAVEATGNIGPMFLLKTRCGYKEETEVKIGVTIDVDKLYSNMLENTQKDTPILMESAVKRLEQVDAGSTKDKVAISSG